MVGYCRTSPYGGEPDAAYVDLLNAVPDMHGHGIGKSLLLDAIGRCTERGLVRLDLHTWSANMKAVPLYKKTGFFWVPDTMVYMQNYIPFLLNRKEFREFAMRGNVVDMAVGIIIGGAFSKIVTSLVNDVIMPPIGMLLGNVDFSKLSITLKDAVGETAAVTLNYGMFINTVIDFIIVAFAIFMVIKQMNRLKKKEEKPKEPTTKECPQCCSTIPIKANRCPQCTSELQTA